MSCGPDQDRLAVFTCEEAGEEVVAGDPRVSDAERAAAGRETMADRFAALLPANRSRAEAQYEAGDLPEGLDVVRVWRPRDPAEAAPAQSLRGTASEHTLISDALRAPPVALGWLLGQTGTTG
jgi:hypothetical protein